MATEKDTTSIHLVSGIIEEADHEAEALLVNANKDARGRVASAKRQASSISDRQQREIENRVAEINRDNERRISMELRRLQLKEQEQLFDAVYAEARRRMQDAMEQPDYREVLKGWILEAAMGLECTRGTVLTSTGEARFIDRDLLTEVSEDIARLSGRRVELSFDADHPQTAQGILLTEEGGGRVFNNQVSTRLVRYASAIRSAIHKELFAEP